MICQTNYNYLESLVMEAIEKRVPTRIFRFTAKIIDYCLVYLLGQLSVLFYPTDIEPLHYLIGVALIPFISIIYETIMLYTFQTTLGRGVFGMTIQEEGQQQLSFKGAFRASLFFLNRSKKLSIYVTRRGKSKFLAAAASLILALGLTAGQVVVPFYRGPSFPETTEGWVHFQSNHGRFSIDFPSDPNIEKKTLHIPEANKTLELNHFTSKVSDQVTYTVDFVRLPSLWALAGSNKILNVAMEALYEKEQDKELISRSFTKHLGRTPAVDFEVKEGDTKTKGRLIISGTKLFRVMMHYPTTTKDKNLKISDSFIQSFNPNF